MVQRASIENPEPTDVTINPEVDAKPIYGLNATFSYSGDKNFSPESLAKTFQTIWQQSDDYRIRFVPEWLKAYQQYNGDAYDRSKAEWQSQLHNPKSKQAVDVTADRIISAIFQTENFFDILPEGPSQDDVVDRAKKMLRWQLRKSDAELPIGVSIKDALISGSGPMKVFWSTDVVNKTTVEWKANEPISIGEQYIDTGGQYKFTQKPTAERRLVLQPIIPTDWWMDGSGRGRFVIQRIRRSLSELWDLTKDQKDADGNVVVPAVYDAEQVARIVPGSTDPQRDAEAATIRRDIPRLYQDFGVDVYEYWGDLIDPGTGTVMFKNIVMTVANKQFVIRKPQPNPFRHGKAPFIVFMGQQLPHQVYGYGMLMQTARIQDSLNRAANVIADKLTLTVPTVECDPTASRKPEELMGDVPQFRPGKLFFRRSNEKAIFFPLQGFLPPTEWDLQWNDRLSNMFDQSTGANEFATGTPTSNNRKTKDEVNQRVAATQQIFNGTAMFMEKYAMTPLLKMIYYLMVQFETDFSDPNLLRVFDSPEEQQFVQSLSGMSPEDRWRYLYLDAEFRCTGIQLSITKQTRIADRDNFMQRLQADPTFATLIDKRKLLDDLMRDFNMDSNLILPQAKAFLQAQEQQQLQQMMAPPPTQPGGQPSATGDNMVNQQRSAQASANAGPQQPQ